MVIEMTRRPGLFEKTPAWIEIAITSILTGIIVLVLESVGIFSRGLTFPFALCMIPVHTYTTLRRRKHPAGTRRVTITQDQSALTIAAIQDGSDNAAIKQATQTLQSEGLTRPAAEIVVTHYLLQVSPERFGRLNGFVQTRVVDA